ncbi:MAG: BrnT family toxin [Gammaproteobacteria bacterium]
MSSGRVEGIAFDEAATVFLDPMAASGPDPEHPIGEDRYITFDYSRLGRLLAVCHTYRPGAIRIITARRVTRGERTLYEAG